jgi:NTE family protein
MLDVGEGADADLASYMLFDGDFARILIDLGHKDAARHRDEMAEFLFSEQTPQ